jgi:hypothetical protein
VLRLVTDVHTTVSTVPDVMATEPIQQNLAARQLAPAEHYLDSGYPSADLVTEAAGRGITMVTPLLADHSPQAKAAEGFDKSAFRIDWKARQVRCPEGATSAGLYPVTQHGKDAIVVDFARADCRPCPSRTRCTASVRGTRMLTLRPRELHERTVAARAEQKTESWRAKYALRSGIEGTINQALDITGIRRGPLPRSAEDHPPTRLLRHRDQHHPPRHLVDHRPSPQAPHQQTPMPQLPTHRLTELSSRVADECKTIDRTKCLKQANRSCRNQAIAHLRENSPIIAESCTWPARCSRGTDRQTKLSTAQTGARFPAKTTYTTWLDAIR